MALSQTVTHGELRKSVKGMYRLDTGRVFKLLVFGLSGWLVAMVSMILLAYGIVAPGPALSLGMIAGALTGVLAFWRSVEWDEDLFRVPLPSCRDYSKKSWSAVANPKGQYANRWAMYEDLTNWLRKYDWTAKIVAEIGTSNGALRAFMEGAEYRELRYPHYDVQNLHQIPDDEFDLVILDQTLEHVEDPQAALRETRRVLKPGAFSIVTTPFLIPVHEGSFYGDYYRWTPQGLRLLLKQQGFAAETGMWGNLRSAKVLLDNMYLTAEQASAMGLSLSQSESDRNFPITVWAVAKNLKKWS